MKRTSRVQTVITPLHRKKLEILAKKYLTINEVIERGIDLLERENSFGSLSSEVTPEEIEQLKRTSEVFNSLSYFSGFALIKTNIIDEFLNIIEKKSQMSDFLKKQRQWILEDIEIQKVVSGLIDTLDNNSESMKEVVKQIGDTFRSFQYSIPSFDEDKIIIYPNYFQKFPELVALQIHGILDFLGISFIWHTIEGRVIFQWTDKGDKLAQWSDQLDNFLLKEFQKYLEEIFKGQINSLENENQKLNTIGNALEFSNWRQGFFVSGNQRFSYIPQDLLIDYFDQIAKSERASEKFQNIGKTLLKIRTNQLDNITPVSEKSKDSISNLQKKIAYLLTSILGWGNVEIIESNSLRISNAIIEKNVLKEILTGMLNNTGYQAVLNSASDYLNFIEFNITSSKVKILVIDDEPFWLSALSRFVESSNNFESQIFTATNGKDALNIVAKNSIEVILCDYNLPELTGIEILEEIRLINPDVIRILVTGYQEREIAIEAINKAHIHYFVDKDSLNPEKIDKIIHQEIIKLRK